MSISRPAITLAVTVVVLLGALPAAAQDTGGDTTPPEPVSVEVLDPNVDSSDGPTQVRVRVTATDDLSGPAGGSFYFRNADGVGFGWGFSFGGTNVAEVTLDLPQYHPSGTFALTQLGLYDHANNNGHYSGNDLTNTVGNPSFNVGNAPTGNHVPYAQINGPYTVPEGGQLTVSVFANDADGDDLTFAWDLDGDGNAEPGTDSVSVPFDTTGLAVGDQAEIFVDVCDVYVVCARARSTVTIVSPVSITTGPLLPEGRIGQPYSTTLAAEGGTQPYTWTVTGGALPPGLTLDGEAGIIAGTPTTAGTFGFVVTVTDANGATASAPMATAPAPPVGSPGDPYETPVEVTPPTDGNGNPLTCDSYALAAGSDPLPPGLTLDPGTGLISGTPTVGGEYTVIVECTYTQGGVSQTVTGEFTITITADNTLPTVACATDTAPNAAGWFSASLTVRCTATDDSGVVTPAGQSIFVDTEGEGQTIVSGAFCDSSGNCATGTISVSVDLSDPLIGVATDPAPNDQGWHRVPLTLTPACTDAVSGAASCPEPVSIAQDGAGQTVEFTAADIAGRTTTIARSVNLDTVAPDVMLHAPADGSIIHDTEDYPATCDATDATSGVTGDCATIVQREAGSSGSDLVTVTATANDVAGNSTTVTSTYTVITDSNAPAITFAFDDEPNALGWHRTPPTVTFTCTDPSGVASCPDPVVFNDDGSNQGVEVSAADVWGNTANLVVGGVNVDTTAPVLAFTGVKDTYFVAERIVVECEAADALSGLVFLDCPADDQLAAFQGVGPHTITATARDAAGNTTTVSHTFTVELLPEGLGDLVDLFLDDNQPGAHGISNSLHAKIANGSWDAFINQVQAKCCTDEGGGNGKRFTRRQADTLVTLATILRDAAQP